MSDGYRCPSCGNIMNLLEVSVKKDYELFECGVCGSNVVFNYKDEGVNVIVYDTRFNDQYRIIYDWNYFFDKLHYNKLGGGKNGE